MLCVIRIVDYFLKKQNKHGCKKFLSISQIAEGFFFLFSFLESFNKYVFVRPYCDWRCPGTGSAVHAEFMNQNRNNNIYRKIKRVLYTSWMVLGAMFQLSVVKNKNI